MALGCFELLVVVGVILALIHLLRSREFLEKVLRLLRRAQRFAAWQLFLVSWGLAVLGLMLLSESAHKFGHPVTTFPVFLLLFSAGILFLWALLRSFVFLWALLRSIGRTPVINPGPPCPPIDLLKSFLAERLASDERARLTAHLENCSVCQHRVEGLTAGQKAWSEVVRKLSTPPPSPEPALRKVMEQLKESNEEATSDEPVRTADLPLGFLSPTDKPGQLGKLERYEVLAEIGRGGMGIVLKAFDPTLHRVVAIKVLAPQLATSGVARKRFLREAKAAAAVMHDHIVTIHAVDEANGLPYLVMQFIAGQSLQDRLDKEGTIELAEILRIGLQTASGLSAAHGQGIVHRDVKPANILLEEGLQRVKITDFGLARAMDDASLTQSGFVAGSPLYMAPEQARGEALDHRADLFSLGSMLYTMCTGRPPFRAANTLAVLRRVSEDRPRPIRETNPEVPDFLAAVIEKLMAKDPSERYQSAGEVVEVLGQHLAQLQHSAWVPPLSPAPATGNAPSGLPTSVTICPNCGASLHVPERMAGTLVHCAECGKPFQATEGSEVIQVAQAIPSPLGPGFRPQKRSHRWARYFLAVWAVLIIGLGLLAWRADQQPSYPTSAASDTLLLPQDPHLKSRYNPPGTIPFGQSTMAWLPPEATLFGAVDFQRFGSLTLDDALVQLWLRLAVPGEIGARLTQEHLGRIRIDGLAVGYYEDARTGESRWLVHVQGVALDGRNRMIDFLRQAASGNLQVDEMGGTINKPLRISSPGLPFALGFFDDNHLYLARSLKGGDKADRHRQALEYVSWFDPRGTAVNRGDLLSGYNPPWIKTALAQVPNNVCGLFLGEIPAEWRQLLTRSLGLPACPRPLVVHLRREGEGIGLSLSLQVEKAGSEQRLRDDLETWCRRGLTDDQAKKLGLGEQPEAVKLLGQTLKTMRWEANPAKGCVQTSVSITPSTWGALKALAKP